jgi:hypothetical protein
MKYLLLCLGIACAAYTVAQVPAHVPSQNLVAWYDFNGNYQDASGNQNHLTAFNTANRTNDRFGNPNSAFAASTAGYLTNAAPSFTLGPTQSFSFSLWVQRTGGTVALMIGTTSANNFVTLFQMGDINTQFGTNKQSLAWIWAQAAVASNSWDHYVCVYNAPNMTLYKNGAQVAANVFNHINTLSANLPLWIGRGVSGNNFIGSIDEVGIWTRALSLAEVQQLYAGCSAGFSAQPQGGTFNRGSQLNLIANRINAGTNSQWQVNTGSGFTNLGASARYNGVTSDTLVINGIDFDLDQAAFRCINADSSCADTSQSAVITVICNQLLENHPLPQSGRMNETASFNVTAYDSLAGFQWQVNTGSGFSNLSNGTDVNGATSRTLQLSNLQLSMTGHLYRCIVSRAPCGDTSVAVALTVINTTSVGENALVNVKVFPNPAQEYWYIDIPESLQGNSYVLRDVQGRIMQKGNLAAGINRIASLELAPGSYFIQISDLGQIKLHQQ